MNDTVFGRILSGEIAVERLYEDEHCIVINDINPKAKVHLLIIPRQQIPRLVDAAEEDRDLLGHLLLVCSQMAKKMHIEEGCRIVINNGAGGGQTVFHLHLHLLGNAEFTEQQLG